MNYQHDEEEFYKKYKDKVFEKKHNVEIKRNNLEDEFDIDFIFRCLNNIYYFDLETRDFNRETFYKSILEVPNIHVPILSVFHFWKYYAFSNKTKEEMKYLYEEGKIPKSKKLDYYEQLPDKSFHFTYDKKNKIVCIIKGKYINPEYSVTMWQHTKNSYWYYYEVPWEHICIVDLSKENIYVGIFKSIQFFPFNPIQREKVNKTNNNANKKLKQRKEKIREPVNRTIE